jgi:Uma2 family endonuclease
MADALLDYYDAPRKSPTARGFSALRQKSAYFRPDPDARYTYADYCAWNLPPDERYELHNGEAFCMASPVIAHELIQGNIFGEFHVFLKGKPCRVLGASCDVRLFPRDDERDTTVVKPDVFVVCDKRKLSKKCCVGAPDLVVEILSPSTRRNDLLYKLNLYKNAGLREYWIVDPELRTVTQYLLTDKGYLAQGYGLGVSAADIPVKIFDGMLRLSLADIFDWVEE